MSAPLRIFLDVEHEIEDDGNEVLHEIGHLPDHAGPLLGQGDQEFEAQLANAVLELLCVGDREHGVHDGGQVRPEEGGLDVGELNKNLKRIEGLIFLLVVETRAHHLVERSISECQSRKFNLTKNFN